MRFTIPSDFGASRDVQNQLMDAVAKYGFNAHSTFAISLALEEAMVNAIKHGNQFDPNKKVHVEARINPDQAEFFIEDEGKGFDPRSLPDPRAVENLTKCSGRGVLLIETYMNLAEWTNHGRRLHMIKKNEPDLLPRE